MPISRYFAHFICAALLASTAVAAPISASDFHARVAALYSFKPQELNREEFKAKSAQLDKFWSEAKAQPEAILPLLRLELASPEQSGFFYYDASKLLKSLSEAPSDLHLVLGSITKADLDGVEHTDYLRTVHWFETKGYDTTQAALRILDYPDFKAIVPHHSLTLNQEVSFVYMLFGMDESTFTPSLVSRLAKENTPKSQKCLLMALWFSLTPEGKQAIEKFASDPRTSPELKDYARELLGRDAPRAGASDTVSGPKLRKERRETMLRPISDEALHEFMSLTAKILAKH
jgi:hypothetical protein